MPALARPIGYLTSRRFRPWRPTPPPVANGPPVANFTTFLEASARRPTLQLYLEGCPDVLCTQAPIDPDAETQLIDCSVIGATNAHLATGSVAWSTTGGVTGDLTFMVLVDPGTPGGGNDEGLFEHGDSANANGARVYGFNGNYQIAVGGLAEMGFPVPTTTALIAIAIGGESETIVEVLVVPLDANGRPTGEQTYSLRAFAATPARTTRAGWSFSAPLHVGRARRTDALDSTTVVYSDTNRFGRAWLWSRALSIPDMRRVAFRRLTPAWGYVYEHLLAQWRMEEGAGTEAANEGPGGSALDLSLVGDPEWDAVALVDLQYREVLSVASEVAQTIDARATRSTVGGITFRVLDTDEWLTEWLGAVELKLRNRAAFVFLGFPELWEDEYRAVYRGAVEGIDPLQGRGYEIRLGDARAGARRALRLGRTTLAGAIDDAVTTIALDTILSFGAQASGSTGGQLDADHYVRIDSEVIHYAVLAEDTPPELRTCTRGALGTVAASHADGAVVEELLVLRDAHPVDVALQLLLSATGDDFDGSGYDVLGQNLLTTGVELIGRGAALSPADLHVAQWEAAKAAHWAGSSFHGSFVVDRVDDVKEFVEREILRVLGAFLFTDSYGRLCLGRWNDRTPGSGAVVIDQAQQRRPRASVDFARIVNALEIRFDKELDGEAFGNVLVYEDVDSGAAFGRSEPLRIDSPWVRSADFGGSPSFSPSTILDNLEDAMLGRFAGRIDVYDVTVGLRYLGLVDLDDEVLLEHPEVPDFVDGRRGLQGVACQVVGRRLDLRRGRVELRLLRLP